MYSVKRNLTLVLLMLLCSFTALQAQSLEYQIDGMIFGMPEDRVYTDNYDGPPVVGDYITGPIVSVSNGSVSQNRTYQDLLKNQTDEYNFEQLATSELYKVDLNGNSSLFHKEKDMFTNVSFSPNGEYLMLTTIEKPLDRKSTRLNSSH